MNINESLDLLSRTLKVHDWFYEAIIDQGKIFVYAHWMNGEILRAVPDNIEGHQVFLHFAGSRTARKENFVLDGKAAPFLLVTPKTVDITNDVEYLGQVDVEELPSSDLESDISDLIYELDRLEKVCGSNILQDIFFEEHDQKNAVTNLSAKFPEIRKSIHDLYEIYGFDIIYEELEL